MSLFTFNEDAVFNEYFMDQVEAIQDAKPKKDGTVSVRSVQAGLNRNMKNSEKNPAPYLTSFDKVVADAIRTGKYDDEVEKRANALAKSVENCEDQSWLERTKAKLEAKIKEYDNKFKQMEEENKKNGGSSISNKIKWVFTKIKQLLLKVIKAIVSALASIQNKFRSKKESK